MSEFANKTHLPAPPEERDRHFTACHRSTGPIVENGEQPTCFSCRALAAADRWLRGEDIE